MFLFLVFDETQSFDDKKAKPEIKQKMCEKNFHVICCEDEKE